MVRSWAELLDVLFGLVYEGLIAVPVVTDLGTLLQVKSFFALRTPGEPARGIYREGPGALFAGEGSWCHFV
jgi:hypothetical protein